MNNTAADADRDRLERGADAVQSNVAEQIRILELAGSGTQSLADQPLEGVDLTQMVSRIDISVLSSLLGVITYPVDADGVGRGAFMFDGEGSVITTDYVVPDIQLDLVEFKELLEAGQAFLSAPIHTESPDRLDYVVAIPIDNGDGFQLVGVVFRPDRMLRSAVEAAGEDQYAVDAVDVRYERQLVASVGDSSSDLEARRVPEGIKTAWELVVHPGPEFDSAGSPWISALVVGTGVLIALLLMWMAVMARSRSEELAERLRLAQELNASKDRFLATVSHELRTPLTVVLGVASEVGPNWDQFTDNDRQELMTMMTEQAVEAANIVEDLLVAARSDPSQLRLAMADTHLMSHIDYALASLPADGRKRVASYADDHPVFTDTTRLRQILRNLLENAVRYGGEEISIDCELAGNTLLVTVADNGDNLGDSDLSRIFEPYEQSDQSDDESPSGVGIGLYVSRLLARLMGGDLECVREDGMTKFLLTLTITEPGRVARPRVGVAAS